MKLSVIIPVYNEQDTVDRLISLVEKVKLKSIEKEIIVINDASTDNSYRKLKAISNIKLYSHNTNKGKGAAIRTGLAQVTGDMVIIQDADLEYNPSDYEKLIKPIISKKAEVVYGTRLKDYPVAFIGKKRTPLLAHYLGNRLLTLITNILFGANISDMETCYKVFKTDVIKGLSLESNRFDIEPEITAKLLKRGHKIVEVPIKVKPRGYDEGKKITWIDGLRAVYVLLKYRIHS